MSHETFTTENRFIQGVEKEGFRLQMWTFLYSREQECRCQRKSEEQCLLEYWWISFYLYSRYSMWFPRTLTQLSALLLIRSTYSSKNSWFYSDLLSNSTASKSLIVSELINGFRSPQSQKSRRWKSGDRAGHDDWVSMSYPLSPKSPVQVLSESARTPKAFGVFRPDQ